jgi:hypothetical protein
MQCSAHAGKHKSGRDLCSEETELTMKNWIKCPSVTTGGKPFFYYALTEKGRYVVVWNRGTLTWHAESPGSHLIPSVQFDSAAKAKRYLKDK